MIIAFMGNDGSGKTTLAKETYNFFKNLGFPVVYKHEYEYMFLKIFSCLVPKKYKKFREEMIKGRRNTIHYLWPYLVWFDLTMQYLYYIFFKKNSIIIFDRYLFDHYASFKYLNINNRVSEWLYRHPPRPDISFILQANPIIAFDRKKIDHPTEIYSLKYYEKQYKAYIRISHIFNIPIISTECSVETSFREVLKIIFSNSAMVKLFIYHCRLNKILYMALSYLNLYELNNEFKKYYQWYQKKKKVYDNILAFIKIMCAQNQKVIIKDPPRNFPWIPEKDIDLIIFEKFQIPNNILNEWKKEFEIDIIPIAKIENIVKATGITKADSLNMFMPIEFLISMIFTNGFVRYDEYLLLKEQVKGLKFNDRGLTVIKNHIQKLIGRNISFPHFIPFTVLLKAVILSCLPKNYKIRVLVTNIISRVYYRITNKLLFHLPMEINA